MGLPLSFLSCYGEAAGKEKKIRRNYLPVVSGFLDYREM